MGFKDVETAVYEKTGGGSVRCGVCPRRCVVEEGELGFCRVRENRDGRLMSLVYGKAVSSGIDPIEKKPLFHYAPGSKALSLATVGCNLRCDFCQNFRISQEWEGVVGQELPPKRVVEQARKHGCGGIAYTYTEPTVFLEYARDTMKETAEDMYSVFVSNGYITEEAIDVISPHLDAINVDLKGNEEFYRKHCGVPDPEPIFDAMVSLDKKGVLVEVTNLIIPGENDSEEDIRKRAKWIKENLGPETPVHFSRFRPDFKMLNKEPTPVSTIEKAIGIAKDVGLYHVYSGNVPGHETESTYCPDCNSLLVKRHGFSVVEFNMDKNMECINCGRKINIGGKGWVPEKLFKGS